jgi:phosphoglycerol transferase
LVTSGKAARTRSFPTAAWSCLLLLAVAAALVWCWHHDRWSRVSWHTPTDYSGDAHEVLARLQAAAEGETWPMTPQVIDRLGAPFGAHWNAYPAPDKLLMLGLGGLSHWIGLFAAANVGLVLAQVTAALSFCLVARWLRVRWEWAVAGALLFAYTYATFHRGLAHFSLLFTWTVPLGLLAVWLTAGSRRLAWHRPGALVCCGAAVALGAHNPYNLFFWLQLMGWALVVQWAGARRRANLQIGLVAEALALVVFGLMHLEVWVHVNEPDGAPLLARNYGGTEYYALKPVEMIIPPKTHRWAAFSFVGNRYARWSDWRGEGFQPYLGLAGIAGLIWLGVVTFRRLLARRGLPGQALSIGWLLAYSSMGGITNLLALFVGLQIFRATNRVGIFISGLVLFFLMVRLSRLSVRWPRGVGVALAVLVTGLGLLDQVPLGPSPAQTQEIAASVASDRAFGRELETLLPTGAMLFQLPMLGFPEVVPPWRLKDYELFRPYLVTHHLRFSYGAAKLRARSRWQRDLEKVPAAELVRRLEQYGFAAIYLNRNGYEDRAGSLLRELAALGYRRQIHSPLGNQVVVPLHPSTHPRLPLARALTYGQGWHPLQENGSRWAFEDAVLSYYNPLDRPITLDLRLSLHAVGPRKVALTQEGRPVGSIEAGTEDRVLRVPGLVLPPGVNHFMLETDAPSSRQNSSRYNLRSFCLTKSSLRVVDADAGDGDDASD